MMTFAETMQSALTVAIGSSIGTLLALIRLNERGSKMALGNIGLLLNGIPLILSVLVLMAY
jgi:hypothetical protein